MFCIHCGTGISLLCHGVLRKIEANLVEKKDVVIKKDYTDTMIGHSTKRRFKGFTHEIPGWIIDLFELYISQLDGKMQENSRFMINMRDKRGTRVQNMGEHTLSKMAKELAARLGTDPKNHTAKSFRRLAAALLAKAGMPVAGF